MTPDADSLDRVREVAARCLTSMEARAVTLPSPAPPAAAPAPAAVRLLVTGSRRWTDRESIRQVLAELPPGSVVIVGRAGWNEERSQRGEPQLVSADAIAEDLAVGMGLEVERYPADWNVHAPGWCRCRAPATEEHCAGAGRRRNQRMLDEGRPTACAAFPLPESVGTWDMVRRCKDAGLLVRAFKRVVVRLVEPADLDAAHDEFGANCGPAALAALLGKTLAEVRPHLGKFEHRGRRYMGAQDMMAALTSIGLSFERWPGPHKADAALLHILWSGTWDTAPIAARIARASHWIAGRRIDGAPWIYDCNHGWLPAREWTEQAVALVKQEMKGATGGYTVHALLDVALPPDAARTR